MITGWLNAAQILIAVTLIITLLLQAKGGGLGSLFGAESTSVFRTKRGLELRLFQLTIVLAILFALISIVNVKFAGA